MARLRMMPKKLYIVVKIDSRDTARKVGFFPPIYLYDNLGIALESMPKPYEIYELSLAHLIRKKFNVVHHLSGTIYQYNDYISAENIISIVTYR